MKRAIQITCIGVCLGLLTYHAGGQSRPTSAATTLPETQPSKKDDKISVSFKDMSIEQIGKFLSDKMKKPVIPAESIKNKKITIISSQKKPLKEALMLIRQALLGQGIMVEEHESLIRIRPVSDATQALLVHVPADKSAATIEDRMQIVTKEFIIKFYDVKKMMKVVEPMLQSFGHILADPDTRRMVITDTVANLIRIEKIVESMDVPMHDQTITDIIVVKDGDAAEIVAIVKYLIAGKMRISLKDITTAARAPSKAPGAPKPSPGRPGMMMGGPGGRGSRGQGAGAKKPDKAGMGGTLIKPSETPVTLVPHVSRNWIIVVAPAEMMEQIRTWVKDLDKPREVEKDYELYDVLYASVNDVAQQITQAVQNMPPELRETTHVVPFAQSKKLIVFGSKAGREIVGDLLQKLDIEDAEKRIWKKFQLKNADAEELAERIETLFSAMSVDYSYDYGYSRYTRSRRDPEAASVTVVPDRRLNTITVLTDRKTMEKIAEMIDTEDVPVDPDEVRPKVYELKYVDAAEMQTLLSEMFSGRERRRSGYLDFLFGGGGDEIKPVGRLLGHFTFQVVGGSNRLIVNSKSGGNYEVIERLIEQLDRPQKAGLPLLVDLKYANAEDLCEQLNAMLAEPSTLATIRRAARGLAHYRQPSDSSDQGTGNQGRNPNPNQPPRDDPGEMVFWWQSFRRPQGQMPASNLVGKIRIVPVYRRNALMVLAPEGYKEPLRELIEKLDQPGQQVMIRARIGEIQHEDQTTLGLRIASDPSIFPPADTAIAGSATADYAESFMSGTLLIGGRASVSALLHLLVKEFGLKILLEPTIITSDNMAAEYFDGRDVPVQTESKQSSEGATTVTNIEYRQVGTRLRVRPHITQTGSVDLMINLEISRIVPGQTALGNFIFDRREVTTHVIVEGGQTIMLSGLIRQEHFDDIRKVPLLGDLWLIGKLFRSVDKGIRNREMVVFITPYVMRTTEEIDEQMEAPKKTLEKIEQGMKGMIGAYRPDTPGEATP